MTRAPDFLRSGWVGLIGGAAAWYGAHELGFYFSNANCARPWIAPVVHVIALSIAVVATLLSFRADPEHSRGGGSFVRAVGMGAGALFALLILWQGVATIIYSGCEQ
jgi:hypothetical protein